MPRLLLTYDPRAGATACWRRCLQDAGNAIYQDPQLLSPYLLKAQALQAMERWAAAVGVYLSGLALWSAYSCQSPGLAQRVAFPFFLLPSSLALFVGAWHDIHAWPVISHHH